MKRALVLLVGLSLAGCSLAPRYQQPQLPTPASWPAGDPYLMQSEAELPKVGYRDVFTDPRLQTLMVQALANNRDLRAASANILAARAQYRIQRAERLPQVDVDGRYTRTGGGSAPNVEAYSAQVGVTAFELDLFGRVRSLSDAALNRYFATEAATRATRLTLLGDVAEVWLTYGADASRLKIAQDTVVSAESSVRLTRARLKGGIAPRTDLRQAETVLAAAQADVASLRTALAQDLNALQLLLGAPLDQNLMASSIEDASQGLKTLPVGLPSQVLLRRPDVVQAEYGLRAANAEIGAARAALFPTISLTGALGYASPALSSLFNDGAFTRSFTPSVTLPIFRAGAGLAGVAASQAQRDAALAAYEKAIQSGFRETADALARQGTLAEELTATRTQLNAAQDTMTLTEARYRGGVDTFLANLVAQRSLFTAQSAYVANQLAAAVNRVDLYRAVGGADGPSSP
ncbi:multidrug efflux system outer membrane protein [Phenylobacterium haematophilum]|uniref:Multidrug efflux system outer membrane protein n=1 Tax=Phenylobacterium haematophilum TaxID=98513 RepID=A0A840A2F8_9CAUL|nr:efflux transporter outer membrane subunit [Phenylobacterium haematophilum]MBB3891691.1 multidrug efflux system outer membrane protein [Phenylobacterium haematophilum]